MCSVLALALILAAGEPAPPAAAPEAAVPETAAPGVTDVPPGSPADRALWRRAYDLDNEIPIERSISSRLQVQIASGQLFEGLAARAQARDAGHDAHERAEHLDRRLQEALRDVVELLLVRWPVDPTRVCGYALLNFESVMRSDETPRKAAQLDLTRVTLQDCVARGEEPLARLRRANAGLRTAIADAERELAARPKAPAAAAR